MRLQLVSVFFLIVAGRGALDSSSSYVASDDEQFQVHRYKHINEQDFDTEHKTVCGQSFPKA